MNEPSQTSVIRARAPLGTFSQVRPSKALSCWSSTE